jgi:hypothetical protein
MEFMQNSDDAESQSVKIDIDKENIEISNDGRPFSDIDVESICKIGRSSKSPETYIGYLGVGFKVAFLISESPQIHSGKFHFKFDKNHWTNDNKISWQIIPIPMVEACSGSSWTTKFVLPLKNLGLLEKLRAEVGPDQLNNRLLLFLRNVKEIQVVDHVRGFTKSMSKKQIALECSAAAFCGLAAWVCDPLRETSLFGCGSAVL